MIVVILSWILFFIVFLSFGEIAVRLWSTITKHADSYSIIDKFWMGICFIGTLLLSISIFSPLNVWILTGISGITIAYWIWKRKSLKKTLTQLKNTFASFSLLEKGIFILVFITILIYSLSTPLIYDEGLYHLQTMQWNEKYGTVLGLGNVHGRLGFNSSFLLLSTVFNYALPKEFLFFSINSLCLLVFCTWLISLIFRTDDSVKSIAAIALILLTSLFTLGANVSSTSTDILPNIFIIYLLIRLCLRKGIINQDPLVFVLLPIFCITLKLSAAAIVLLAIISLFTLYRKGEKKSVIAGFALCLLVGTPWIIRFVMLTGYFVYPFPAIDIFNVDWKIPIDMVAHEKDIAYAWARIPNMDAKEVLAMNFGKWFPIWIQNLSYYNLVLYLFAFISPIILIVTKPYRDISVILAWGVAYIGIIFGLFTAPDFRFSYGFLIAAVVMPFLIPSKQKKRPALRPFTQGVLIVGLVGLTYIAYSQVSSYQYLSDNASWSSLIIKPQNINLLQKKVNISFEKYKLNNTTIFIPKETNQCFDQRIPCVPYYNSNLEMRGHKIQDGFRIKK